MEKINKVNADEMLEFLISLVNREEVMQDKKLHFDIECIMVGITRSVRDFGNEIDTDGILKLFQSIFSESNDSSQDLYNYIVNSIKSMATK